MSTMVEKYMNIEDNIKIINEVVDTELDDIDDQDEDDVFFIDDDSEYGNYLLIVPEEENNYTKIEIMDCLEKIQ